MVAMKGDMILGGSRWLIVQKASRYAFPRTGLDRYDTIQKMTLTAYFDPQAILVLLYVVVDLAHHGHTGQGGQARVQQYDLRSNSSHMQLLSAINNRSRPQQCDPSVPLRLVTD